MLGIPSCRFAIDVAWLFFKTFWSALDVSSMQIIQDISSSIQVSFSSLTSNIIDAFEEEFSFSTLLLYFVKSVFFHFFDPVQILANWGGSGTCSSHCAAVLSSQRQAVGT